MKVNEIVTNKIIEQLEKGDIIRAIKNNNTNTGDSYIILVEE